MGIRSLLRNAFGRSKATREESGAAPSGAGKPESATIPEAREESTPAAAPEATPEAEVPAARTAPSDDRATDPAPAPAPTLPAQGSPVDRTESPVRDTADVVDVWDAADVRDEPTTEAAEKTTAEPEPTAETEPEAEPKAETTAEPEVEDTAAAEAPSTEQAEAEVAPATTDLVSQAFDKPAPVATPAAEPVVEAVAEPVAEPVEAKTADAEPVEAKTADAEPQAEAEADAAPKAEAEAEPTSDPQPETAPEKTAEAATEPEAAPKATPEATPEPAASEPKAPEATEAAAVADATEVTEAAEDAAPTPGTSLPTAAPALLGLYKAAGATLEKHGLTSQRAAVYLVLDRSGSMRNYYKDGTVQNLAEQALGLAAHFDEDPTVPVVFFSTDIDGTADIDLTNYEGRIEELHAGLGHMGRTNYHWAVNAVVEHYKKSGSTAPAFVLFQTDGAPTSKPAAERALCEAAELPIFWQFIGFGDPEAKGFDFLRKLDDLTVPEKRRVDNAGFFHAGREPHSLSHEELYQQLMVEFPEWLTEARTAGVLKDN
ncbi:vWA domain-containing protein [Streptomyces lydicus]|uniref:vWA domain-containing protein n=1 Tax=Streptomyces lydicus TaxID=47763 RepID=UPI0036E83FBD